MNLNNKKISIIGLGYVGLPLAIAFAEKFEVVGYDINESRIQNLKRNNDQTLEVESKLLESVRKNINYTSDMQDISDSNIYIVTVPTPIDEANRPDLEPLIQSSLKIGSLLKKGEKLLFMNLLFILV